jgi:hypothetical protein
MEVPILVRSLSDHFLMPIEDESKEFPVQFDPDLMATLDAGLDPDDPGSLVQQYAYNWWDLEEEPDLSYNLWDVTVDECLDIHRQQKLQRKKEMGDEALEIRHPVPVLKPADCPTAGADCLSCCSNADLIRDLLVQLQKTWEYADSIQTSTTGKLATDMRRAAGFYQLHQQSLIKEHLSAPAPAQPSPASVTKASEQTRPARPSSRM